MVACRPYKVDTTHSGYQPPLIILRMPKDKLFDTQAVLQKAMELFWRKGYNGTSINDLVDATGLSRSSLYATFEDKHKLYVSALRLYQNQEQQALMAELNKQSSARRKIEIVFRSFLRQILDSPYGKGCFMVNTVTEMTNQNKELARITADDFANMEALFLSLVKEGQASGEIARRHKPVALARFLFSSYLGFRITGQSNPDRAILEDIIKTTLTALD